MFGVKETKKIHRCGNPDCQKFGAKFKIPEGKKCTRCGWDMLDNKEFDIWVHYEPGSDDDGPLFYGLDDEDDKSVRHSSNGVTTYYPTKKDDKKKEPDDTFTAPACLIGCPIAQAPQIAIPYQMYQVWIDLARKFDTEWLAYLQGEVVDGVYVIKGMTFPEQTATGVHVNANDGVLVPEGTIAAVHSHVGMEVFFSGEDKEHFNHPIELVVNRKGEILANGITTLACGNPHRGPAKIIYTGLEDATPYIAALKAKLEAPKKEPAFNGTHAEHYQPPGNLGTSCAKCGFYQCRCDFSKSNKELVAIRHHRKGVQ